MNGFVGGPEALALVELDSVASGLRALDALVKKARVSVLEANLVEPGKFLLLVAGPVGELGEAFEAATAEVPAAVGAKMFLARVEHRVVEALRGRDDREERPEAIGLVEGRAVAPTIEACDRSLKRLRPFQIKPLRLLAVRKCEEWLVEHMGEGSDGLGAISISFWLRR